MLKFLVFINIFLVALSVSKPDKQARFDASLGEFYKKINGTKFPKNQTLDTTKPNNRQTNEFSKKVHDIFTFAKEYKDVENTAVSLRADTWDLLINSNYCPYKTEKIVCDPASKYRTYDGTCNNLKNPLFGAKNTPYQRLLSPAYDDGINSARSLSVTGRKLPNPRTVSLTVSLPSSVQRLAKNNISQLYASFGQFLAHDITGVSATTDLSGVELDCPCESTDKNCIPFQVPSQDRYLGMDCLNNDGGNVGQANLTCITPGFTNQTCIKATRSSASFPDFECSNTYREQMNILSSYIDGTAIYGSDETRAKELRTLSRGLLKTSGGLSGTTPTLPSEKLTGKSYLPLSDDVCSLSATAKYKCFKAGEHRTSENVGLVGIQTLFNREHNRIATELAAINPLWNDETLYQETRRIIVAILQHITYNEFVPELVGDKRLMPLATNEYFTGYDPNLSPQLYNEFTTAAFRMGHSLMRQKNTRSNINQTYIKEFVNAYFPAYSFHDSIFKTDMAFNARTQGLNSVFLGLVNDIAWKFGTYGTSLQNNFMKTTDENGNVVARDLFAINVNRGRDHGIQPYVKYIKYCFNVTINTFADLTPRFMNRFNMLQLQSIYENVNDIDLYAGGLSETIVSDPDFVVGQTFGCILMKQFEAIKKSDRFYYENGPDVSPNAFTLAQLEQIKNVTMSGLICNNYDLFEMQLKALYSPHAKGNTKVDCKSLSGQLDLKKWSI